MDGCKCVYCGYQTIQRRPSWFVPPTCKFSWQCNVFLAVVVNNTPTTREPSSPTALRGREEHRSKLKKFLKQPRMHPTSTPNRRLVVSRHTRSVISLTALTERIQYPKKKTVLPLSIPPSCHIQPLVFPQALAAVIFLHEGQTDSQFSLQHSQQALVCHCTHSPAVSGGRHPS